jgi:hypothetical protein
MKRTYLLILICLLVSCREQEVTPRSRNVILITFDGVRYEEFFNRNIFKQFWRDYSNQGVVLGDPQKKSKVRTANATILSLPAYRTIHSGKRTFCLTNDCKRIKKETIGEKIMRLQNPDPLRVAVISSWDKICFGAMSNPDSFLHNCGNTSLNLPGHDQINREQNENPPSDWSEARLDRFTWTHSIKYIKNYRPRFMHISLNNSDEYGHNGNWYGYIKSLKTYDGYIQELIELLKTLEEYGEATTIIITTDHGRGKKKWSGHTLLPHARKIWMYFKGPDIPHWGSISHRGKVTHLDLKPWIEWLVGIHSKKSILKPFTKSP